MRTQKLLLIEYNGVVSKTDTIREGNKIVLRGKIQCKDTKNGNGRIYPGAILERADREYQELIHQKRSLGQVDHPPTVEVSLKDVGIMLRKSWWEGNNLMGEFVTTSNSAGKDLRALIEEDDVTIGISSRGFGSVSKRGEDVVVNEDYQLVCYDAVHDPSTAGAFLLKEGKYVRVDERKLLEDPNYLISESVSVSTSKLLNIVNDILNIKR